MENPRLNSHFLAQEIREFHTVHLGIAVALEDGLVVPVIRNAEKKDLAMIQTELADLSRRARMSRVQLHEIRGSTFTVSNLGMFGIEQFTAILNPPEVGILSVGNINDIPAGVEGQVVLRPIMKVTLNVDHRAVDGVVAARFVHSLKKHLEAPAAFFT
jgi:pyruvate dehydrogenase E2 component (dihydrolipoamide acetyltransferase)